MYAYEGLPPPPLLNMPLGDQIIMMMILIIRNASPKQQTTKLFITVAPTESCFGSAGDDEG